MLFAQDHFLLLVVPAAQSLVCLIEPAPQPFAIQLTVMAPWKLERWRRAIQRLQLWVAEEFTQLARLETLPS
jgi:hypothetical protein